MMVEDLCRKLRPIYGDRIDKLWRAYRIGDFRTKKHIESVLFLLAEKKGETYDYQHIYLKPPPFDLSTGKYVSGNICYGEKELYSLGLDDEQILSHILIAGQSGSGKTNTALKIVKELSESGVPITIFDWKRSWRDILATEWGSGFDVFTIGRHESPFFWNPIVPPPSLEPFIWANKLIEAANAAYYAGHGVMEVFLSLFNQSFLDRGIYQGSTDFPTFYDLYNIMDGYARTGRMPGSKRDWVFSTSRIIKQLSLPPLGYVFNVRKKAPLEKIFERNCIFELDVLTDAARKFFIETYMLWRFYYRMATTEKREVLRGVMVMEEAHHIFSKQNETLGQAEPINERILRMMRELGDGVVMIDQDPSLLSIVALANSGVKISMNLGSESDIRAMSSALLLRYDEKRFLGRLPVGSGIVKLSHRYTDNAFLMKFPHIPIEKGKITDLMLAERAKKRLGELMALQTESTQPTECPAIEFPQKPEGDKYITKTINQNRNLEAPKAAKCQDAEASMLIDVLRKPESCLSDRSLRLGLSGYLTEKVKEALEAKGLVTIEAGKTEAGRPIRLLRLTDAGRLEAEHLAKNTPESRSTNRFGGKEHTALINEAAQEAKEQGYHVIGQEVPLGSGKLTDMVIEKDGRKVAVEAETGKAKLDIVTNVRKNLEAGQFSEVWSVPKNEVIFGRTKTYLEKAGIAYEVGEIGGKRMFKIRGEHAA